MNIKLHLTTGFLLPIGAAGGLLAETVGLPMPWMLGSLLFVALAVSLRKSNLPENYEFPTNFRKFFMAFIGIMIGSQVNWALINQAPQMLPSLVAISFFCRFGTCIKFFYILQNWSL